MNLFKKLFGKGSKNKEFGALPDDRPAEEKEKDFEFEEIVSAADPVDWRKKSKSEWRRFPIYDQNGSGSCVAHTVAKLLGINYFLRNDEYVHFSATDIYQRRKNKPASGMYGVDALNIARDGVTLEVLAPSQDMTDEEMDSFEIADYKDKVGDIFNLENYVVMETKNIDKVASTIQKTNKGVMVWFYFTRDEWTDVPKVKEDNLPIRGSNTVRHSLTAVDFTTYNGKKALIIEDSWGPEHGFDGQRVITEDFFNERNFFTAYALNFNFEDKTQKDEEELEGEVPSRPGFTESLRKGDRNEDVKELQDILKFLGHFPDNVDSTGYYGSITAKAVYEWQIKNEVADREELDSLQGYVFGPKSRQALDDQLYDLQRN